MKKITVFTAGDSRGNPGPSAIGVYVVDEAGAVVLQIKEAIGNSIKDFAGYMAVLKSLAELQKIFTDDTKQMDVEIKLDNEQVKKQLNAEEQITNPGLVPYFVEIHNMRVASFPHITFTLVTSEDNKEAERLVNEALDGN